MITVVIDLTAGAVLAATCGLVLDQDWNAALNILLAVLAPLAAHRTAGQAETGSASAERIASG